MANRQRDSLLAELVVWDSPALEKIRLGSAHDGGYVIPNVDLAGVDYLYTVGVGANLDFEFDFRKRSKASIKLFDPTIATPCRLPARAEFYPVGLGYAGQTVKTLFDHGRRPNLSRHRLWLKIDIEGWEWPTLEETPLACLEPFEVVVLELHDLTNPSGDLLRRRRAVLRRLNRSFRLVHAHGNNYCPIEKVGNTTLPSCLEVAYVRKDLVPGPWRPNRTPLPGLLDSPCYSILPDLDIHCWPFCATRPLARQRSPGRRR